MNDYWKSYPRNPRYMVSILGEVIRNEKLLHQNIDKKGYRRITMRIDGKPKSGLVHRMVALTFTGESDLTVDHINGDKTDNRLANLRYMDRISNALEGRTRWHTKRMLLPSELDRQLAAITYAEAGYSAKDVSVLFNEKQHNVEGWLNRFRRAGILSFKYRSRHAAKQV